MLLITHLLPAKIIMATLRRTQLVSFVPPQLPNQSKDSTQASPIRHLSSGIALPKELDAVAGSGDLTRCSPS